MDKDFIEKQRKKLIEKRNKLKKELKSVARKKGSRYRTIFPNFGPKEDENAEEVEAYVDAMAMQRDVQKSLTDVDIALEKIKRDRYGICEKCKKEIDKRRLQAYPEAATCLRHTG